MVHYFGSSGGGVMSALSQSSSGLKALTLATAVAVSRAEVPFVGVARLAHHEGRDAGLAIGHRPGDHREARDHAVVDQVGVGAARRRRSPGRSSMRKR